MVLKNDREHLNAHLVERVTDWQKGPWGTWEIQASGDLAELVRRGKSFSANLAEIKAAGVGVVSGRFQFGTSETTFDRLIVDMQGLAYATPTMQIADKRIRLETSGTWNSDDLAIALGPTSLLGETIQFRTDRLRGKLTEDGLAVACKADVAGIWGRFEAGRWCLRHRLIWRVNFKEWLDWSLMANVGGQRSMVPSTTFVMVRLMRRRSMSRRLSWRGGRHLMRRARACWCRIFA